MFPTLLTLLACHPSAVLDLYDSADPENDTGTPADDTEPSGPGSTDDTAPTDDTETTDSADSGDSGETGDSGTTGPILYKTPQIGEVTSRLHDDFGSLVYVSWEQLAPATVWVEFSFDEGEWWSTPPVEAGIGPQEHLLLGVPYGMEVSFRVVNDFSATGESKGPLTGAEQSTTTEEVPDEVPLPTVTIADPLLWNAETPWVMTSMSENGSYGLGGIWWVFIVDRQGRVVWARETPRYHMSMHAQLNYNKDSLLIDYNTYWATYDASGGQIYELKIDGTEVAIYDTPGLHHPFTQTADGSLLWGSYANNNETLEELGADGSERTLWDCEEYLDEIGERAGCGSNTVFWSEPTGTVLFSMFTLDTVIELDYASGEVLRTFGHLDNSWRFDPLDSAFWYQHGAYYTPEGTLLLSTHDQRQERSTVVREYELDEAGETLVEIWNFGLEDPLLGEQMGEAHRLESGNILHNYGTTPRLREATYEGEIVWDIEWDRSHYIGRSTMLSDLYAFAP